MVIIRADNLVLSTPALVNCFSLFCYQALDEEFAFIMRSTFHSESFTTSFVSKNRHFCTEMLMGDGNSSSGIAESKKRELGLKYHQYLLEIARVSFSSYLLDTEGIPIAMFYIAPCDIGYSCDFRLAFLLEMPRARKARASIEILSFCRSTLIPFLLERGYRWLEATRMHPATETMVLHWNKRCTPKIATIKAGSTPCLMYGDGRPRDKYRMKLEWPNQTTSSKTTQGSSREGSSRLARSSSFSHDSGIPILSQTEPLPLTSSPLTDTLPPSHIPASTQNPILEPLQL